MGLGDTNVYSAPGASGSGADLASLAGSDIMDAFNMFMGCSSAFYCVHTGDAEITIPYWNGDTELTGGGAGIWQCVCDPVPDDITAFPGWTSPLVLVAMQSGAEEGDFYDTSYTASTGEVLVTWFETGGGALGARDPFNFFVLVVTSIVSRSYSDRVKALGGND